MSHAAVKVELTVGRECTCRLQAAALSLAAQRLKQRLG
jgi:hypothetical protein